MVGISRNTQGLVALGLVLFVWLAVLAGMFATPAFAVGGGALGAAAVSDEGRFVFAAADDADGEISASPRVTTDARTMRVYQEATIKLEGATFKSSNAKVASVSKSGLVKAKKQGKTTITAANGSETYVLTLTVKKSKFKPVPMKKLKRYRYFLQFMSKAQLKKAYKKALKIVRPLGDLNKKDRLMGVAMRLREYFDRYMSYSMTAKHYGDPYGYFIKKKASCAGCARATGLCLNILGINYEHVNENKNMHQWARVKVGKKRWICDAYGLYCGPEPGKRKHPYL